MRKKIYCSGWGAISELVPKPSSVRAACRDTVITSECGNSSRSVIYGFSNGFYRWNTFVGIPTSEVWGQVLNVNSI
ncbi:hypothetical protein [Leptospira borgpetersenii]|uniref:hypothetical protein n=1 Tax=Leptospira borgpetersenii TaxID=174 RepID=UPI0012D85FF4|nr:hypothetical protein [Leptospira borgpetersenii]MBE8435932.1 hypothetical protein [Leptospira borgpetersenii serovar Tarassovi]UVA65724.1 hypothetical protein LH336_11130 [Leptospira borgpetersenii]